MREAEPIFAREIDCAIGSHSSRQPQTTSKEDALKEQRVLVLNQGARLLRLASRSLFSLFNLDACDTYVSSYRGTIDYRSYSMVDATMAAALVGASRSDHPSLSLLVGVRAILVSQFFDSRLGQSCFFI
jgi:hypothetical protein